MGGARFGGRGKVVRALDGVSFDLRKGETLGIVGESGCGKSTLARTIVGLETPTSGSVRFRGADLHRLRGKARDDMRRRVQIVLQDPYSSLNPRRTVRETLLQPFHIHPEQVPRARREARIRELVELVGLNPDHLDRYPFQFSGGQRQRIGIARALTLEPEVIVCDEPVSALDVSVQAQVVNLFQSLQRELGLAYVFIAHDLSVVRHISDRIGVMYLGRVAEIGDHAAVYDTPSHPYTSALLSAVPIPDPALRGTTRVLLAGDPPSPVDPPSGCRFRTRCWKAQDRCATEEPVLRPRHGTTDEVACHFPLITNTTAR
ncbi:MULTISPECIES: oligopeptide/dipeptide ABC transporter ATP-binding protein [unclassified Microbacterium]|nr:MULTISPECIES: oligopeptide/dipeptide ABC transporter ATP-binding protein [unclassified Microbacterium]MCR2783222.1 ATP-binding cassette domain-containing protein [Microbacterium sp. zg.B96]WIM17669.1 ATP-binding cassette domain-containing protein [Microbacterium sp. zg-B96]